MRKPLPDSRICKLCGLEFKPKSPSFRCRPCTNEDSRIKRDAKIKQLIESGELVRHEDRKPEEMQGGSNGMYKKYRDIKKMVSQMDRDEFKVYLKDKLNQIMENEMLFNYLSREGLGETPKKGEEIPPKLSKREKVIYKGDTRNMSWDEYQQLGFGGDEDK